jgi:putative ABC transport system ATP-binding protein
MSALGGVGLARRANALPTELSGGERQRVAIARALVNRPSLLLCDEPTGNLDSAATKELTDLLGALHEQGTTLLVITHNPVVAAMAQRQIRIRDGSLSEQDPALRDNPAPPDDPWVQDDPWMQEGPWPGGDKAARSSERNGGPDAPPGR